VRSFGFELFPRGINVPHVDRLRYLTDVRREVLAFDVVLRMFVRSIGLGALSSHSKVAVRLHF
jgi:hypothetical protein